MARWIAPAGLGLCVGLSSCVTEVVDRRPRGVPVQRLSNAQIAPRGDSAGGAGGAGGAVPMPAGPVAAPARPTATVDSRVVVAVRPMGRVPFDGQTLPLVAPDGGFLATQVGAAPSWGLVLAAPMRARPTAGSSIQVYDLSGESARRVETPPLGDGPLLLGRDADARGVLVESPRADGSRWIGRLGWGGALEWLVQDASVNAHAVFITPGGGSESGGLVFTRRELDGGGASLVVRTLAGDEWVRPAEAGRSFAFPLVDASGSFVMGFVVPEAGGGSVSAERGGAGSLEARVYALSGQIVSAAPVSRRVLVNSGDAGAAYQAVASLQPSASGAGGGGGGGAGGAGSFLFLHPGLGRMTLLDAATGAITPLAEGSVAGVVDAGTGGFFLTTARGLSHQRLAPAGSADAALPEARVLAESWVARVTGAARAPIVLIGPGPGGGAANELAVTAMQVVPPEAGE